MFGHLRSQPARVANRPSAAGFTLVEVIVVVAIVTILAALSLPMVQRSLVGAKRAECSSNLRQIGTAIHLYANDHDGRLPGTTHELGTDIEAAWIFALKPYVGGVDEIRICPADPKGPDRLRADGTSYILNSYVFVPRIGPFGEALPGSINNVRAISQPSQTLFASNISDAQGVSAQSDHTHSDRWEGSWGALCADIQPDRFTTNAQPDHTEGSANYLFADGHVETIAASVVKERLERGDNIARPPDLRP